MMGVRTGVWNDDDGDHNKDDEDENDDDDDDDDDDETTPTLMRGCSRRMRGFSRHRVVDVVDDALNPLCM